MRQSADMDNIRLRCANDKQLINNIIIIALNTQRREMTKTDKKKKTNKPCVSAFVEDSREIH